MRMHRHSVLLFSVSFSLFSPSHLESNSREMYFGKLFYGMQQWEDVCNVRESDCISLFLRLVPYTLYIKCNRYGKFI